jgi:bifunctional DNA-binding transcriptional regulator/antitoxin component of YhaV-PrlF toxin-antitoxin module
MAITKDMLAKFSRPPKGIIRPWIKISEQDIGLLLRLIKEYEEQGFLKDAVISSSEVEQLQEQDVESFIWEHPTKLGKYQPLERQYDLKSGNRVDLILRGDDGLLIIEVKKSSIGREAYKQLNGYLDEIMQDKKYGQDAKLGINGAIICEDIMPAFEDFYQKLIDTKKIIVYLYGWRFNLNSYGQ